MTNPADRDPVLMAVADGLETTAITRHNLRSNLLAHLSGGIPLAVPGCGVQFPPSRSALYQLDLP